MSQCTENVRDEVVKQSIFVLFKLQLVFLSDLPFSVSGNSSICVSLLVLGEPQTLLLH